MKLSEIINAEPLNAERTNEEVREWLLEGSGSFEELLVNERGLYAQLGPAMAESILQTLEAVGQADPVVKRALKWLEPAQGGLDMGSPHVRGMVAQLQALEILTAEQATALLSLATERTRAELAGEPNPSLQQIEYARGQV